MYNVSNRPSKIVTKSRRGMNTDPLDSSKEQRVSGRKSVTSEASSNISSSNSAPRPVFHSTHNHRKSGNSRQPEAVSTEHSEVVQFVSESWSEIWTDYENHVESNTCGPDTVVYHEEKGQNKLLEDFKPFDLEAWWGRRLFNTLTKTPT